jgi:hypothetical protein
MAPESVRHQIGVLGAEVVPRLKGGWDGAAG